MIVARTIADLRDLKARSVLVPTMGALHAGHEALIRTAADHARARGLCGCVVSVFVNPTQFDVRTDLDRYPRVLEHDVEVASRSGASAVYAPDVEEVYPPDRPVPVPPLPAVATLPRLEDATRPGHFAGVCQVVKRLFDLLQPAAAVFGEKDWQQLQVVRAMVRELAIGVEIISTQTVREPDGLAMSSRNVFLSPADRQRALSLHRSLLEGGRASDPAAAERIMWERLVAANAHVNYAAVRDAETLMPALRSACRPMRALINAKIGDVRLLDNAPWPLQQGPRTSRNLRSSAHMLESPLLRPILPDLRNQDSRMH